MKKTKKIFAFSFQLKKHHIIITLLLLQANVETIPAYNSWSCMQIFIYMHIKMGNINILTCGSFKHKHCHFMTHKIKESPCSALACFPALLALA